MLRYDLEMTRRFHFLRKKSKYSLPEILPEPATGTLKLVGWASMAAGAVAIGIYVGRELRLRYKFNRRTPYDYYSHAGDEGYGAEYGVGI